MSLAELLIVLAIMAILAGLAAPRFAASAQRRRYQAAFQRIQADIALARESARATSSSRTLRFSTVSNAYELLGSNALQGGRSASVQLDESPYNATLTYVDFGGAADLVFDGYGRIVTGGELRLQVGSLQGRLTFAADNAEAAEETGGASDDDSGGGGLLGGILGLLGL